MLDEILIAFFVCYVGPTLVDSTWHMMRVRKLQTCITKPPLRYKNQVRKLELSPLLLAHMYFQGLSTYIT